MDLVVAKGQRLLVVEVKGRSRAGPDGWGRSALGQAKRARLARAWSCWLEAHPSWGNARVELVYALVPLPPSRRAVRWIRAGA